MTDGELASILELTSQPWHLVDGGAWSDSGGIIPPGEFERGKLVPIPIRDDPRVILVGELDAPWILLTGPWFIDHEIYRVSAVGRVSLRELYASRLEQHRYRLMHG